MNVFTDIPVDVLEPVDREVTRLGITRKEYIIRALKAFLPASRTSVPDPAPRKYPRSVRQVSRDSLPVIDKLLPVKPDYGLTGRCPECNRGRHCNGSYEMIDSSFRPEENQVRFRWLCGCDCARGVEPAAPAPADPEVFPE